MRRFFLLAVTVLVSFSVSADPTTPTVLTAEEWARPRSGETLTQQPGLRRIVAALEQETDALVTIAHGSSEDGQLWAEELRSWLVALGVASARIRFESRPELQGVLALDVRADTR